MRRRGRGVERQGERGFQRVTNAGPWYISMWVMDLLKGAAYGEQ